MRIALVSTGHPQFDAPPRLGGIQQRIRGLAEAFLRRGNEVHLIARQGSSQSSETDVPYLYPIKVRWSFEVLPVLIYSRQAAATLEELEPEIFSLHERFSAFFPSRLHMPKAFFAHNYDAMRFYAEFSRSYRAANWGMFPLKNWLEEECMRRCDLIVALNQHHKEYLEARELGPVVQIPNAIDPGLYHSGPDENYILFAGRLSRVKGVEVMEEAFERIVDGTDVNLHIAGDGPLRNQVESWRVRSGLQERVRILGWLKPPQLRDEISRCSFLILPSLYEGFPGVLLEAMACRKPVIASKIPGSADAVRVSETGFLSTQGDSEELARYCRLLVEDTALKQRLGRAGRADVEKYYTWDVVASRLLQVYERVLN